MTVKVGISCRKSYLAGGYGRKSLVHGFGVFFKRRVTVIGKHCGNSLGNGFAGDYNNVSVCNLCCLNSSHNDVFVIGKNEYVFRGGCLNCGKNVFGGRVHGLAAGNNVIASEIGKNVGKTFACANGNKTVFNGRVNFCIYKFFFLCFFCGCFIFEFEFGMRDSHIFHLGCKKGSERKSFGKNLSGLVGVDMEFCALGSFGIFNNFAESGKCFFKTFGSVFTAFCNSFDAVNIFVCFGRSFLNSFGHDDFSFGNYGPHTFKDINKSLAACINNSALFKDGEHFGGLCKGAFALKIHSVKNCNGGIVILYDFGCFFRCAAGNGKNGSFGGFHNCFVSCLNAEGKCCCDVCAGCGFFAFHSFGKSAEKKGKDYAGVSSCSAEKAGSGGFCNFFNGNVVTEFFKFFCSVTDGHGHVCAGVAVGNREYVKCIDLCFSVAKVVCSGNKSIAKLLSVYQKSQLLLNCPDKFYYYDLIYFYHKIIHIAYEPNITSAHTKIQYNIKFTVCKRKFCKKTQKIKNYSIFHSRML